MRCKFILFLIFFISCDPGQREVVLPFKIVRVNILSKYRPAEINLHLESGKVFLSGRTFEIKNNNVKIRSSGKLHIHFNDMTFVEEYAGLVSDNPFTIELNKNLKRVYSGSME